MRHRFCTSFDRRRRALGVLSVCLLLLVGAPGAAEVEVTILATTDFHGALVTGGSERDSGRPWGGAVALSQLVRRERERRADRTFLLDGGDQMQGTPESNLTAGRSAIAALNAFGVDAAALGNHEFDWSLDTLRARRRDMRYPMLAANVFERSSGRRPDWIEPYTIVERDGVRLGVIGFATPETPRVTLPQNVASLRFDAPEPLASGLARELRRRGADLVVVVCHIGGFQSEDGSIHGPIADLARASKGVDAVVGGHTHSFVAGFVDGVPVVVAGSNARALGRIVLGWDGRHSRALGVDFVRAWSDSLVVASWDPIAALVDSMQREVRPFTERQIGQAARPLGRTDLANLVTDAMREAVAADVAITNPGGLRRELGAGPITAGMLFELLPFENALVTFRLTGNQLRQVVASRPEKVLLSGLRGSFTPGPPLEVVLQHLDGTPLRGDSTYVVVTNSFLATGGDGFAGFDAGDAGVFSSLLIRDAVSAFLESRTGSGRAIDPDSMPRFAAPPRGGGH